MKINKERLEKDIKELGQIGFKEGAGVTRVSYSDSYNKGVDFVKRLMELAGLTTYIDSVGNLIGRLEGETDKTIAVGSHIDSVPEGGIYDGTLGVLAGIECIRVFQESEYQNYHSMEVIAFVEEEGNVIGGTFGSKCFTGVPFDDSYIPKMEQHGINMGAAKAATENSEKYKCYLELHIEQGGILEKAKKSIGIVEGIVSILRYKATVKGIANHAGTTPMYLRDDALIKTCRMVTEITDKVHQEYNDIACTVGRIDVYPGAVNVIPGEVKYVIELRGKSIETCEEVIYEFYKKFRSQGLSIEKVSSQKETMLDKKIIDVIKKSCHEMDVEYQSMFSGAGHDAMNMALFTPSAMIFIPSIAGISHNMSERSSSEDIGIGCQLLLNSIIELEKKR